MTRMTGNLLFDQGAGLMVGLMLLGMAGFLIKFNKQFLLGCATPEGGGLG